MFSRPVGMVLDRSDTYQSWLSDVTAAVPTAFAEIITLNTLLNMVKSEITIWDYCKPWNFRGTQNSAFAAEI
jgi:hypothetical protein